MSSTRQSGQSPAPSRSNDRTFTAEQANSALPLVKRIVTDVVDTFERLKKLRERHDELIEQRKPSAADETEHQVSLSVDRLNELLLELDQVGAQVKDFETGLVDFPGRRNDQDVLLCWKLGEEKLTHWHDQDGGFAGRRPLDEAVE